MRSVEIVSLLGTFIGALMSASVGIDKSLMKSLKLEQALSEKNAYDFGKLKPLFRWRLYRLTMLNVIIKSDENKYYLNEKEYRNYRKKRILFAISIILIGLILIAIFL